MVIKLYLNVFQNFKNPVKTEPKALAKELIHKDLKKIIDEDLLFPGDSFIIQEYLISFITSFHQMLELDASKESYTINESLF